MEGRGDHTLYVDLSTLKYPFRHQSIEALKYPSLTLQGLLEQLLHRK